MAMLKSEVLHRRYRRRARPIAHYTLGWMPRWARLGASVAPLANAVISQRWIEKLVLRVGGMDSRRAIPRFARPFRSWWKRRPATPRREERPSVLLWVDSFSDNFSPAIGRDVVAVLDAAGIDVVVPERSACCGLTWISTGQLDAARRKLLDLLDVLAPYAGQGMPILGLEPSCTAVLRSDLLELLTDDPRAHAVSAQVVTLAELLASDRFPEIAAAWQRPDLTGTEILIQPHCHQHAVMGADLDVRLLRELGARVTEISGCCGLAGNFGMERGHYEVSVSVAENGMLPALRDAPSGSVLLADGLSCRTQAEQLGGVSGIHLAQLLAERAR
jgi:Fe-S oxidoreductase